MFKKILICLLTTNLIFIAKLQCSEAKHDYRSRPSSIQTSNKPKEFVYTIKFADKVPHDEITVNINDKTLNELEKRSLKVLTQSLQISSARILTQALDNSLNRLRPLFGVCFVALLKYIFC